MKQRILVLLFSVIVSAPLLAQESLYPVRARSDTPTLLTEDHLSFVAEKTFEHKLTLGYPSNGRIDFLPSTRSRIVVLWLRIENLAQRPMTLDPSKFKATDDSGKSYSILSMDEAFNRLTTGPGAPQALANKTLRGISLGKLGSKITEEQLKEDLVRYSLQSAEIAPRGVKEGAIYFDAPQQKKFTFNVLLGDLWSRPFPFSTDKSR